MSRKELHELLVSEGFSVIGVNGWKMGSMSIALTGGFLVVELGDGGSLSFPFRKDCKFELRVYDRDFVRWWNGMSFFNKI